MTNIFCCPTSNNQNDLFESKIINFNAYLFKRYDIKANTWTQIAPMSEARGYPACINFMGSLFVIGGQKNSKILASVEHYIPCVNKWVQAAPLNIERTSPQAGVANDTLYVCGGVNQLEILATIERYDHVLNSWTMVRAFQ